MNAAAGTRTRSLAGLAAFVAVALTACSAPGQDTPADGSGAPTLTVLASFYPLQYVAQQVGGAAVEVASLTPPGAEPHDLELSPRQVREVGDADVVVYLAGFQPAVDEAVDAREPAHLVDASRTPDVAAHRVSAEDGQAPDPHFWLDPTLLAAVAQDVAAALTQADPAHADDYAARAEQLAAELADLDASFTTGLATCDSRVLVTAHAAFGYLASRYDLEQVGISGIDPEAEPSPARLREIRAVITDRAVGTVFTETLLNPKVSQMLADDVGVRTAVLDPVESQTDPGADYRDAMELNLAALRAGLGCS